MTTICAYSYNHMIAIAADNRIGFGDVMVSDSICSSKIISFGDAYLGVAGSSRIINIFENDEDIKEVSLSTQKNIFDAYNLFANVFQDKYHFNLEDEEGGVFPDIGFSSIVINKTGIYSINHGCEILLHKKFWSIGSGSEYCLGAMSSIANDLKSNKEGQTASSICKSSIAIAASYDPFTNNDLDVKVIKI